MLEEELFRAVKTNNILRLYELIDTGANLEAKDSEGCIPLHYAGTAEVAQALISRFEGKASRR